MPDQTRRKFLFSALGSATLASGAGVASVMKAGASSQVGQVNNDFDKKNIRTVKKQAAVTAIPPFANVILNRMGFGPRGSDIADFNALGVDDDARLLAYVDQQLDWSNLPDPEFDARISQAGYTTLDETQAEQWQLHRVQGVDSSLPLEEIERLAFLRALYSKRQLLEFLADFWHNHFNIYGRDTYARPTWTSWDRDVIRPPVSASSRPVGLEDGHLMGNFRQMLELSAKHPAMIYYLDNYVNGRADPNENYAREIIELHTLGAINYAGPDPQPGDINTVSNSDFPAGFNDKYSDADVYEAMRFLTGWNVRDGRDPSGEPNTGEWYFWPDWHDNGQKQLLGVHWGAFTGVGEVVGGIPVDPNLNHNGNGMLDLLAYHPGTAEHIALKLCTRFLNDTPPATLVAKVKQTFIDTRHAPDQLAQTYRTLLLSTEFKDTLSWGNKLKRPFEAVASAMRACDANFTIRPDDTESYYLLRYTERAGQRPFYWRAPDGYPDKRSFWEGGASLINTWRVIDWLVDENATNADPDLMPVTEITVLGLAVHTPDSLAEFWLKQILKWEPAGGWAGTSVHAALSEFMSTRPDDDPSPWPSDFPIDDISANSWPYYWNERLRGLVKLVLATPEFMQR
jgi:uncharacterized protein (DUF1800 family)